MAVQAEPIVCASPVLEAPRPSRAVVCKLSLLSMLTATKKTKKKIAVLKLAWLYLIQGEAQGNLVSW